MKVQGNRRHAADALKIGTVALWRRIVWPMGPGVFSDAAQRDHDRWDRHD